MRYMRLRHTAVVVPEQEAGRPLWSAQHLGAGSVVGVMKNNRASYITGRADEVYVKWMDVAGRATFGWLSRKTEFDSKPVKVKQLSRVSPKSEEKVTAWDTLRYYIGRTPPWTTKKWVSEFGRLHVPLLHAVIRELGGKVPSHDKDARDSEVVSIAGVKVLYLITGKHYPRNIMKTASKKSATKEAAATVSSTEAVAKEKKNGKKNSKKGVKVALKKSSASKKKPAKRTRAEGAGRTSSMAGKVIVRKVSENPRREGSKGFKNWKLYKKGMTYEQFLAAGGIRSCLAKDVQRGSVKLVSKK